MKRFTLARGTWYACELIGDEFVKDKCSYSPIRIDDIVPAGVGDRSFMLKFYHANYPEGVRDKSYLLQTVHRGETLVLARSIEHDPPRFLQIYEITPGWLKDHFGLLSTTEEDPQALLDRAHPAPNKAE